MADSHDPQTQAQVYVDDWYAAAQDYSGVLPGDRRELTEFVNTVGFTYTSDVLSMGDPFTFQVPNPDGRYRDKFQRGAGLKLFLTNPRVNGGRPTLKHTGIVVNRAWHCTTAGNFLDIQGADLGWHLRENDAPLWYVLQGATLERLLKDPKFIHPSWGIKGIVTDTETTKLIRRGLNNSRAQLSIDMQALGSTVWIQVEPGDKVADLILTYCRRIGRLFTVSPDGYMQVFTPNETAPTLFTINYHGDSRRSLNNVISCSGNEDLTSIWNTVTCIGEVAGGQLARDSTNQNALKRRGTFVNDKALPFRHNLNFTDGEIFNRRDAQKQAQWRYARGIFDSFQAQYVVRGHHQNGNWWESDQYCTVHDSQNGIEGDYYVQAVTYSRDAQGDRTTVTLRKPGLLRASYGVYARAPRHAAPSTLPVATTEGTSTTTTTTAK